MAKMKDSGVEWIGEIPEGWEVKPVKRYFSHVKRIVGNDVDKYERLSLTMQGVLKRSKDDAEGLQPEKFNGYQILQQNELVFKLIDLENVNTSRVGISPYTGLVSPAYIILSNKKKNNTFYYYWFMNMYYQEIFNKLGDGGVRSALNASDVLSLPMVYLNEETQQKIATYLDEKCSQIEQTIQNQQQVIERLKAYKQSLITEAVTGKVKIQNGKVAGKYEQYKDSGVEWIGEIPSGWEVAKYGRYAQVKSNLVDPNKYLDYPQVAPDNIEKGSGRLIDYKSVRESGVISWNHLFFKGQIVYSKIRPTLNKVIIASFDGLCSADMYPIETEMNKQFFIYMMLSHFFVEQVGLITRDRVKMPKINQNELSRIMITIPILEEQKSIAEYLDKTCTSIDSAIEQKQKLIEKLTEYKKSLIYECVTGKKEIQ